MLKTCKAASDRYKIKGRMVGNQIVSLRGHRLDLYGARTDTDSFVANLYLVTSTRHQVIGVLSGCDDAGRNAFTSPFILSQKGDLTYEELMNYSYQIMIRNLTDIRALKF
mgnify:CR=1 FL=1